jgi:hypothetical protein
MLKTTMCQSKKADLELIGSWIANEKIQIPIDIDSIHSISDFATVWERQKDPKKNGCVVIKVDGGW